MVNAHHCSLDRNKVKIWFVIKEDVNADLLYLKEKLVNQAVVHVLQHIIIVYSIDSSIVYIQIASS